MYYTDNSILPENMAPLIITAAPYGPAWLPGDAADIAAVLGRAGSGRGGLLRGRRHRAALPRSQPGHRHGFDGLRAIQLLAQAREGSGAGNDHSGRRLDLVLAAHRRCQGEVARLRHPPHAHGIGPEAGIRDRDDRDLALGHRLERSLRRTSRARTWKTPRCRRRGPAWWWISTPAFYVEHLKRLRKNGIQPYFVPAASHQWELIERCIRAGVYMGPLNMALCGYGGGTMYRNPFDWMHFLQRVPQGRSTPSGPA